MCVKKRWKLSNYYAGSAENTNPHSAEEGYQPNCRVELSGIFVNVIRMYVWRL